MSRTEILSEGEFFEESKDCDKLLNEYCLRDISLLQQRFEETVSYFLKDEIKEYTNKISFKEFSALRVYISKLISDPGLNRLFEDQFIQSFNEEKDLVTVTLPSNKLSLSFIFDTLKRKEEINIKYGFIEQVMSSLKKNYLIILHYKPGIQNLLTDFAQIVEPYKKKYKIVFIIRLPDLYSMDCINLKTFMKIKVYFMKPTVNCQNIKMISEEFYRRFLFGEYSNILLSEGFLEFLHAQFSSKTFNSQIFLSYMKKHIFSYNWKKRNVLGLLYMKDKRPNITAIKHMRDFRAMIEDMDPEKSKKILMDDRILVEFFTKAFDAELSFKLIYNKGFLLFCDIVNLVTEKYMTCLKIYSKLLLTDEGSNWWTKIAHYCTIKNVDIKKSKMMVSKFTESVNGSEFKEFVTLCSEYADSNKSEFTTFVLELMRLLRSQRTTCNIIFNKLLYLEHKEVCNEFKAEFITKNIKESLLGCNDTTADISIIYELLRQFDRRIDIKKLYEKFSKSIRINHSIDAVLSVKCDCTWTRIFRALHDLKILGYVKFSPSNSYIIKKTDIFLLDEAM